jgi:hypothetical protein
MLYFGIYTPLLVVILQSSTMSICIFRETSFITRVCQNSINGLCRTHDGKSQSEGESFNRTMSTSQGRVEDVYESQNDQQLNELHAKLRSLRGVPYFHLVSGKDT